MSQWLLRDIKEAPTLKAKWRVLWPEVRAWVGLFRCALAIIAISLILRF